MEGEREGGQILFKIFFEDFFFLRFYFGGGEVECGRTCPLHAAQALLRDLPESRPFSRQSAVRIFFLRGYRKEPKNWGIKKKNHHALLRDDCV